MPYTDATKQQLQTWVTTTYPLAKQQIQAILAELESTKVIIDSILATVEVSGSNP